MLKIPFLVKIATSESNVLADKRVPVTQFTGYHYAKEIYEVHNHPVSVSGHAVREMNACYVLGESFSR